MKKMMATICAFVTLGMLAPESQAQWSEQASPTVQALLDVRFWDANSGWAGGDQGILRTANGGTTWTMLQMSGSVNSVHFESATEGWLCGNGGVISKSLDAGASWTDQPSGTDLKLRDIWLTDALTGWSVGRDGLILKTINGGTSWSPQTSPTAIDLNALFMLDGNTGWCSGSDGLVIFTNNGGTTWTTQLSVPLGNNDGFHTLFATDAMTIWTAGDQGRLYRSVNGGTTWTAMASGTTEIIESIYFTDANNGWMCGTNGWLSRTTNGGATWVQQTPPASLTFNSLYFVHGGLGYVVSDVGRIFKFTGPLAAPTALTALPSGSDIVLSWTASPGATGYQIHRSTASNFSPDPGTQIGTVVGNGFTDAGVLDGLSGMQFYVVVATN